MIGTSSVLQRQQTHPDRSVLAATPPLWKAIDITRRRLAAALTRFVDSPQVELWDRLAFVLFAVLVGLVTLTFRDYGITTDEDVQQLYGGKLWAFYLSGFADRSAFHFDNLYLYGGLFDMVAVALQHALPFGTYDTRHLLCGLVGVLGIVGTWRLAREIGGPRIGFIAAALLALTASWYGAMFNNTKDIPFAVGMTWLLYLTCLLIGDLPRPRLHHVIWFGIVVGLTLGQRFGGVLALIYLGATVLAHLASTAHWQGCKKAGSDGVAVCFAMLPAVPIAYLLMAFFWPWSVQSPLNPLEALAKLTEWPFRTEFDGTSYRASDLPWSYLPSYLAIKVPEVALLGILLAIGFAAAAFLRQRWKIDLRGSLSVLTIASAVLMPLAYVLVARPAIYNGMRHFFFLMPPLYTLAALGLDRLWCEAERRTRWVGVAFALLLAGAAMRELTTMIDLHPHEYIYFNALVGGPAGAYRNYEMDYWSNFLPEAIEQLDRKIRAESKGKPPSRTYTVAVCTAPHVLDKFDIPYLKITKDWKTADFIIPTTNNDCDQLADGRTVITVERDGAVLGIVKDRRSGMTAQGASKEPRIR